MSYRVVWNLGDDEDSSKLSMLFAMTSSFAKCVTIYLSSLMNPEY
jgi:hypothetical protein